MDNIKDILARDRRRVYELMGKVEPFDYEDIYFHIARAIEYWELGFKIFPELKETIEARLEILYFVRRVVLASKQINLTPKPPELRII